MARRRRMRKSIVTTRTVVFHSVCASASNQVYINALLEETETEYEKLRLDLLKRDRAYPS